MPSSEDRVRSHVAVSVNTPGASTLRLCFAAQRGSGLAIAGVRDIAILIGNLEKDVWDMIPIQEPISQGKFMDTAQCVLYDTHNGFVGLQGYNLRKFTMLQGNVTDVA